MGQEFAAVLSMIGVLLLMIAVFVGAYFVTKFVGKRYQVQGSATGEGIELLARKPLGKEQSVLIIRAAGRVFLLGASPQHIDTIGELDPEAFPPGTPATPVPPSFSKVFRDLLKQNSKTPEGGADDADAE